MIFFRFSKNRVLVYSWSTLLWHWCDYPHRSRDAFSPICRILLLSSSHLICNVLPKATIKNVKKTKKEKIVSNIMLNAKKTCLTSIYTFLQTCDLVVRRTAPQDPFIQLSSSRPTYRLICQHIFQRTGGILESPSHIWPLVPGPWGSSKDVSVRAQGNYHPMWP